MFIFLSHALQSDLGLNLPFSAFLFDTDINLGYINVSLDINISIN